MEQIGARVLVIVDPQHDFIHGSLAIEGAEEAMQRLCRWVGEHTTDFDAILLTMDQHPQDHCSFVEQGGIWPRHCVRYSLGASLYPPLMEVILTQVQTRPNMPLLYVEKGTDVEREEYSAFSRSIPELLLGADRIYLAGLAGDYCVAHSQADLSHHIPQERIIRLEDCIAYVDPSQREAKIDR